MKLPRIWPMALSCLLGAAVVGCASLVQVAPYRSVADIETCRSEDARLWSQAQAFDKAIAKGGYLFSDDQLNTYLQTVMGQLFPEFEGRMRVRVINGPEFNAFALPNGSIYIHMGLLAGLYSEAQVAAVLAHEGTHFTHRHALHQNRHLHMSAAVAQVLNLSGIPLLGPVVAISSMAGYSRDLERDADEGGYARLAATGYDRQEAVRAFENLNKDAVGEDRTPFFFSSHPALEERIANFREMNRLNGNAAGKSGSREYLEKTATIRLQYLEELLSRNQSEKIIRLLTDAELRSYYPPSADYFLGESYRMRAGTGDLQKAEETLRQTIRTVPDYALAYRALGMLLLKAGDRAQAAVSLQRYLSLSPDARDRAFINDYLRQ